MCFEVRYDFYRLTLSRFQNSLFFSCQDDIKDKVTPNTPEAEVEKFKVEFDTCAIKCCDTNIQRLPSLSKKVMETLKSGKVWYLSYLRLPLIDLLLLAIFILLLDRTQHVNVIDWFDVLNMIGVKQNNVEVVYE